MGDPRFSDLRRYLDFLEAEKQLVRVRKEVDPKYEIAAILHRLGNEKGPAVLFENVKGYNIPVVGGVYGTLERVAMGIGTTVIDYASEVSRRFATGGKAPVYMSSELAPVKEVKMIGEDSNLLSFPVITHQEKDASPYITAGVIIAYDKELSVYNVSTNRIQVVGPRDCNVHLAPGFDLWDIHRRAELRGEPVDISVNIGVPPAVHFAAVAPIPLGQSELDLAGAMLGEPVEVVQCETVDCIAIANAEIVIEAQILPNVRGQEGPFSDCADYYTGVRPTPSFKVTAITSRANPIYQAVMPGAPNSECDCLHWAGRQYRMWEYTKMFARDLKAIHMTSGGAGEFHIVVSLNPTMEGEVKNVISALFALPSIKLVTVVNDDVNIYDPNEVEWAVATRFQADRDLVVLHDALGIPIDPSVYKGVHRVLTAKMGIDATYKGNHERFERARPHPEAVRKVAENWREYFGG